MMTEQTDKTNIKEVYVVNRGTLSIETAFIEPDDEWFWLVKGKDKIKCYNDINPDTGIRTGKFHFASDVFTSKEEGVDGLRECISKMIFENTSEIHELEKENARLENLLENIDVTQIS